MSSGLSDQAWLTVAHEIGHNFNARHSFSSDADGNVQEHYGGIMDYGSSNKQIEGAYQFNTQHRQAEICDEVAANIACPAFSMYTVTCGDGTVDAEAGEQCECPRGSPDPLDCGCCVNCRAPPEAECTGGSCCDPHTCRRRAAGAGCDTAGGYCSALGECLDAPCGGHGSLCGVYGGHSCAAQCSGFDGDGCASTRMYRTSTSVLGQGVPCTVPSGEVGACPGPHLGWPDAAICVAAPPTMTPTTPAPTSPAPSLSPSSTAPTVLGDTFSPTTAPITSGPTPAPTSAAPSAGCLTAVPGAGAATLAGTQSIVIVFPTASLSDLSAHDQALLRMAVADTLVALTGITATEILEVVLHAGSVIATVVTVLSDATLLAATDLVARANRGTVEFRVKVGATVFEASAVTAVRDSSLSTTMPPASARTTDVAAALPAVIGIAAGIAVVVVVGMARRNWSARRQVVAALRRASSFAEKKHRSKKEGAGNRQPAPAPEAPRSDPAGQAQASNAESQQSEI